MLACSRNQLDAAPQCPFYGRVVAFDRIFMQGGNQCALITSAFSPCGMEFDGDRPYWRACRLNPEVNRSYQQELARRAEPSIEDRARAESYAKPALDLTRRADV